MFKIVAISALFLVFAIEAADLSCKTETSVAVGGKCADGQSLLGENCCATEDVFDVDAYACHSEPLPSIGSFCPYGFTLVSGQGCCANSDAYAKQE
ncbi:unnamed protein product [Caenorhabditis sp. 36 PRJEB53466]|nr:unnamed protein product [Caenorhabditis sp. 36 PRJEB53466]